MIITLLISFVFLTAVFIGYQVYMWKQNISPMKGMMIAMTIAMMTSLALGITTSTKIFSDPTIATIYMMILGVFIGYIVGFPFGILAQLDGVLAGIMGGLMGPMTGLMINNGRSNLFIGFFTLVYVFTSILVYQLIHQCTSSITARKVNRAWFLFLPLCFILTLLAIVQASTETHLNADLKIKSDQKNGYQEATIQVNANGYSPSHVSLKIGIPTKLHFQQTTDSGCLSYLLIQDLGINKELKKGDNIISFTPNKLGKITFTCGMGMYHGAISIE
jgi:hypothetical protein